MRIDAENIVKTFKLRDGDFKAVDGISLHVEDGARVGIIGRNGSGKSTFLSILSGLQDATSGMVSVEGRVDCILAMGSSMSNKLTGRQNIYRDGRIRGRSQQETDAIADKIIAYADIGAYIDHPVGTYSSGMRARLAFAMMVFVDPGILIVDEALSVGDAEFGSKATATMKDICARGKILLLVSHSMPAIREMCNRVLWIEAGKVVEDGPPNVVIDHYLGFLRECEGRELDRIALADPKEDVKTGEAHFESVKTVTGNGDPCRVFRTGEDIALALKFHVDESVPAFRLRGRIEKSDGNLIWESLSSAVRTGGGGDKTARLLLDNCELGTDVYECYVDILKEPGGEHLAGTSAVFKVQEEIHNYDAVVHHDVMWRSEEVCQ